MTNNLILIIAALGLYTVFGLWYQRRIPAGPSRMLLATATFGAFCLCMGYLLLLSLIY